VILRTVVRDYRRVTAELCWIASGQGFGMVGSLIGVRVLTSLVRPSVYGEISLVLATSAIVMTLLFGPLQQGMLRLFSTAGEEEQLPAFISGARRLLRRLTVLVLSLAIAGSVVLNILGLSKWAVLVATASLLALLTGYERALDALQSAARQRAVTAWHQAISRWGFLCILPAIWLLGPSSPAVMLGYLVSIAIVLLSQYAFFRARYRRAISAPATEESIADWAARVQQYATPFMFFAIFPWLQQSSDRWGLQIFRSAHDIGLYAVLLQLGFQPVLLVSSVFVQLISPIVFEKAGNGLDPSRLRQAQKITFVAVGLFLVMTVLITLVAAFFHEPLFNLFLGKEYRSVTPLMPWMILAGGVYSAGEVAPLVLMSRMHTQRLVTPKIVISILGVVFNIAGAAWLGIRGVVLASVCFASINLVWMILLAVPERRLIATVLWRRFLTALSRTVS
jgi:O-antigen/teichoic acid export membrane protein